MDDLATDLACEETLFKETEQWSTAAQRAEHLVHGGSASLQTHILQCTDSAAWKCTRSLLRLAEMAGP